ncbi:MAG: DUF6922 domain-containing protein [Runella sp.]
MTTIDKPRLRRATFWDTDFDTLDYEHQANAIIKRVFEYGTWEEILETTIFYGEDKIRDTLVNARALRRSTIALAAALLGIPKKEFYSFHNRPKYLP